MALRANFARRSYNQAVQVCKYHSWARLGIALFYRPFARPGVRDCRGVLAAFLEEGFTQNNRIDYMFCSRSRTVP